MMENISKLILKIETLNDNELVREYETVQKMFINLYGKIKLKNHSNFIERLNNDNISKKIYRDAIFDNLKIMENMINEKSKVTTQSNINATPTININNSNTNSNSNSNVTNITFEQVISSVENSQTLSPAEITEVINKVKELEKILAESNSKSKKFDKAKPILKFLVDKGIDACIAFIPFLCTL